MALGGFKMKVSDFKLFSDLPDGYEYETMEFNGELYAIGKRDQYVIGFKISDNKLVQVEFKQYESGENKCKI